MAKYIVKRLLAMVLTLFIIITISFFAIRLIPGDVLGEGANPELRAAMRARYHLDKPLIEQYVIFIKNFLSFDFGESINLYPRRPVFDVIAEKVPLTLVLNIFSLIITIPTGIACGIAAALKKNTLTDHAISTMVVFNVSVPSFVFASLLQYFLAYKLGWFPILLDLKAPFMSGAQLWSMVLPVLALSFGGIATITRYMRAELFEALSSEYMLLARAKGLTQLQATVRHALRNSFIPLCNVIVPMFMSVLSGSMVVETIFNIPGLGSLMTGSISTSDYYLTIAILFVYSLINLTSVLVVDLSYGIVDPRIRIGGGKTRE
ncbi:MAG: ABC transporter permease [Candidatus Ventricola sp.]